MTQTRRRLTGLGGLFAALMLLLAACGQAPPAAAPTTAPAGAGTAATAAPAAGAGTAAPAAPAASGEPIKIGAIFDLTGATADVGTPYSQGQVAFIAWKNEQGGIAGRKIDLISSDYSYQVPKAEELYTQYVTQDKVVVFSGWGTGDTEALRPKITQDKVPFISASYSVELADPAKTPYNFLVAPTYSDQLVIAQKWALEDWAKKGKTDKPKFAYLVNDSPFGRSPLTDGKAHAVANGLAEPLEVPSPKGATDLTPQLTQIKDYGANYVFFQNVSSPVALALKNAKSLGMQDVGYVCLNWCANEILIKLGADAAEGVVGTIPFNPVGAEGAQVALDYAKAKGIDFGGADSTFVQGWTAMSVLMEGVERVVKEGKELTGENIKAALETLKDFDTGGVTEPVTFTDTDHRGTKALKVFQVKGGKWEPITDFVSAE